jgi:hypothetical protein
LGAAGGTGRAQLVNRLIARDEQAATADPGQASEPRHKGERRTHMSAARKGTGLALVALAALAVTVAAMLAGRASPPAADAASHREAPLISLDPPADITDFFFFKSYEAGMQNRVALIMDVMSEEPSSGPNYWNFDPNVTYSFSVDNNRDGVAEDVKFEFKFRNEFRGVSNDLGLFLPYVALPPITKLADGAGSEGLGFRQRYSVTMVKGGDRTVLADGLIAAPSNVGPRTMPNYDALAAQAVYSSSNSSLPPGVRVFAGQRDDPFYIDLGAVFDTLNLRSPGVDMLAGFNVHEIAIELPAMMLSDGQSVLGAYASTSRPLASVRGDGKGTPVQVQRLANRSSTRRSSARRTRIAGTRPSLRTRRSSSTTTRTCGSTPRCRLSSARPPHRCSTCRTCCSPTGCRATASPSCYDSISVSTPHRSRASSGSACSPATTRAGRTAGDRSTT